MSKFSKYIDSSAPLGVPIRHKYCPLCERRTTGFVVIPDRKGYLLYCHSCKGKKWIPRGGFSPTGVKTLLSTPKKKIFADINMPSDTVDTLPATARVWLYQYGLDDKLIKDLGFKYSEKYHRLIMPCYDGDLLVHWQGRYLGDARKDRTPKYITRTKRGCFHWVYNPTESDRAILVEDMLSAIQVGLAGYAGVCLFGSYLKDSTIDIIASKYKKLTVWLDPDKRKEATKYTKRFSALGYNFNAVLTAKKDPKEYTKAEIKKYLR